MVPSEHAEIPGESQDGRLVELKTGSGYTEAPVARLMPPTVAVLPSLKVMPTDPALSMQPQYCAVCALTLVPRPVALCSAVLIVVCTTGRICWSSAHLQ